MGEHAVQVTQGKMAALEHETVVAKLEGRVAHHANAAEQAVRKISALAVQVGALEMQIGALEEQRLLDLQACTDATEAASSAQTLCEDETKRRELLEAEVTKARVQLADADAKITALSATLAVAERQHAERGAAGERERDCRVVIRSYAQGRESESHGSPSAGSRAFQSRSP